MALRLHADFQRVQRMDGALRCSACNRSRQDVAGRLGINLRPSPPLLKSYRDGLGTKFAILQDTVQHQEDSQAPMQSKSGRMHKGSRGLWKGEKPLALGEGVSSLLTPCV